jgi:hypothetical protein
MQFVLLSDEQLKCFESSTFYLQFGLKMLLIFLFSDLDKYDLYVLQRNVKIDYKMALEMTSEILLLELIHRVVVCIFEVRILYSDPIELWHIPPPGSS